MAVGLSIAGRLLIYMVSGTFLTLHLKQLGYASLTIGVLISLRSLSDVVSYTIRCLAVRVRPLYLVVVSAVGVAVINLFVPILTLPAAAVALMVLLGVFSSQTILATVTVIRTCCAR